MALLQMQYGMDKMVLKNTGDDILSYTSQSNYYETKNDGLLRIACKSAGSDPAVVRTIMSGGTNTTSLFSIMPDSQVFTISLPKGFKIYLQNPSSFYSIYFYEYVSA